MPCLYSFRRCPYAIRARMALAYSAISVELREIRLSNIPQELLRISPKAAVPVLHFPDGTLFEQSLDIMHWALSVSDPQQWQVDDFESQQLMWQNDEDFKPLLDAYKYAERFPQLSQLEHRNNAEYFLRRLEHRLVEHPYLAADRQTIADIAIMPFIRQFAGVEPQWFEQCEFKALRHWLQNLLTTPLFKRVMSKYDFWKAGDATVYF